MTVCTERKERNTVQRVGQGGGQSPLRDKEERVASVRWVVRDKLLYDGDCSADQIKVDAIVSWQRVARCVNAELMLSRTPVAAI